MHSSIDRQDKTNKTAPTVTARQSSRLAYLGHILMATWAVIAAIATSSELGLVKLLDLQTQSLFFELRGAVAPPDNVVILAIDEESLSVAEQYYRTNPQQYAELEPLQAWPWKRQAYAKVIALVMEAGARSVAIDILFTTPSSYGAEDDRHLAQVLRRYPGRITLAAEYENVQLRQGSLTQMSLPERIFWTEPMSIGTINFPLEAESKVHRFASEFPKLLAQDQQPINDVFKTAIPSFEQAAATASQLNFPRPSGDRIFFYGPKGTFEQVPFWHILDPDNWNTYLGKGKYFKDKVVIIGATAASLQDFHGAPFSKSWLYPEAMPGVEIQASAIATLLQGRAIASAIPNKSTQGLFVLLLVAGTAVLLAKPKRAGTRFMIAIVIVITWSGISYFSFVVQHLLLPTAAPILAIALGGFSYLGTGAASDSLRKLNLRRILERHASSPVVQEIISQQDDLQDLLYQRELAIVGKIIGGRYKIVKVLGAGGFSETYVAEDRQLPGNPLCVVKQLRPANNNPKQLQLARRLFQLEAETLLKLGQHHQIPQLFAYFEEGEEFYVVQELIVGHPLSYELILGKPLTETAVMQILHDILQTLEFVHSHNVIHRDIKPSNIMRRNIDSKLVLIDFGAVKEVTTQLLESPGQSSFTIGIGTQGYAPSEQCAGRAYFSSDIYAVGMIGIRALTGLAPHEIQQDSKTGEFSWTHNVEVSSELAAIINKMVRYDFTNRYQSALEVRLALEKLVNFSEQPTLTRVSTNTFSQEDADASTVPWIPATTEIPESPSSKFTSPP